jgi:hypothetical protein
MSNTIALVAFISKKQAIAKPAKDLYASDWFKKASTFATLHPSAFRLPPSSFQTHPS